MNEKLLSRAVRKWNQIQNIVMADYSKAKEDFFRADDTHWKASKESSTKIDFDFLRPFLEVRKKSFTRLAFLYEDFYIHTIILLDLIARLLTDEKCEEFPSLVKASEEKINILKEANAVSEFAPFAEKIRYWRNKFFVHVNIIHPFPGAARYSPAKGNFEFLAHDFHKQITETDITYLISLRDKYSPGNDQTNFWELIIMFNDAPIKLEQSEVEKLKKLYRSYGSFLPKLENLYEKMRIFVESLDILNKKPVD